MKHRHFTRWPIVEGYTEHRSFVPGEEIAVHASSRAERVRVEVIRIGAERELMWSSDITGIGEQPVPADASSNGCGWPSSFTIPTQASWPSGFYEISFTADADADSGHDAGRADGGRLRSEAFFVLRGGKRPDLDPDFNSDSVKPVLVVLATNTWNAYNQWGGACLYSGGHQVSFERPLERGYLRRIIEDDGFDGRVASAEVEPDPEHLRLQRYQADNDYPLWSASSGWHNWDRRFVAWAERNGMALDFAIDADLDTDPDVGGNVVDGYSLVVTIGHSEYWTWGMRDTMDAYLAAGGNWVIFSGNTCFWQVRYQASTGVGAGAGTGREVMVGHKGRARFDDPVKGTDRRHLLTSMWSDPWIGRPENTTIGLSFSRGGYHRIGQGAPRGAGAYTVWRPDHWALDGTDLRYGDQLGAGSFVVGYEVDGCALTLENGLPVPTGEDSTPATLEVLATAPARLLSITDDHSEAPAALWASTEPPGDLEGTAMVLFGGAEPEHVARLAHGRCVMGSFTAPGPSGGTVFNCGSADWAYGLDSDPLVGRITANVITKLNR